MEATGEFGVVPKHVFGEKEICSGRRSLVIYHWGKLVAPRVTQIPSSLMHVLGLYQKGLGGLMGELLMFP